MKKLKNWSPFLIIILTFLLFGLFSFLFCNHQIEGFKKKAKKKVKNSEREEEEVEEGEEEEEE